MGSASLCCSVPVVFFFSISIIIVIVSVFSTNGSLLHHKTAFSKRGEDDECPPRHLPPQKFLNMFIKM